MSQSWTHHLPKSEVTALLATVKARDLTELSGKEPTLKVLLALGFFGQGSKMARLDAFRSLQYKVRSVKVDSAELKIDNDSGKTVINFGVLISFEQGGQVKDEILYLKTHKQIKHLLIGLCSSAQHTFKQIKYLQKEQQIN